MSPDSRTVSQIPSFCNCNCILKDFHDFRDFHFLREFYGQYSHSKESYLASFLSITVDKSCRHRMHLFHENYFISSFLHSLVLSLFPISVDEIASLLPCFLASMPQREKVVRTHKKLLLYLAFKSLYNKWRRMGTDHSQQAPQIWYIRSNISVVEGMMIFQDYSIAIAEATLYHMTSNLVIS